MDIKHLINYLPFSYKERDTYKVDGKGILESFLELFGTYLDEIILPEIDNILDNIDLDKAKDYYLNYLWEFLGELPFGYYVLIDKGKWDKYYNPADSEDEYETKKKLWEITKEGPVTLSPESIRRLLQYAITLIKVRGTIKFFEAIFRIYGLKCTIDDPIISTDQGSFNGYSYIPERSSDIIPYWDDDNYRFDTEDTYDNIYNNYCKQCIPVDIDLSPYSGGPLAGNNAELYSDIQGIYIYGKRLTTTDILQGIADYTSGEDTDAVKALKTLKSTLEIFFDKYLPFNVRLNKLTFINTEVN